MRLLEGRGPCWPNYTFEIPWHKHQLPPFSIKTKWYCKKLVVSLLHLSPTKPVLKWDTHCESQFLSALSYGFLVCLVGLDKGKNLSRCLCPGSRPIFCLACNSPLTDSQAVASWKFVAKKSQSFMAGYYQPNSSQSFGSTFNSERGAPLQPHDHVSRQSVC